MNEYSNLNVDQENEKPVSEIELILSQALLIIDKQTECIWSKFYQSLLPPALCPSNSNRSPIFYKYFPKKILNESREFFAANKNIGLSYFMLGQYSEFVNDKGKITQDTLELYKKGAQLKDPFCMFKISEILIRDNEKKNMSKILLFLWRSFIITSIEPYKFLNNNLLVIVNNEFWSLDSFWYLSYYFCNYEKESIEALEEAIKIEKCSDQFKECLIQIFKHVHNPEKHIELIKMLEETVTLSNDKKAAFHFCMFSFLMIKMSSLPINLDYILNILKYLADEGNYLACEKIAVYLDNKKDYSGSFVYLCKAEKFLLPTTLSNLGTYYCSFKNPMRSIDLIKAGDYWKKSSYFGACSNIEYLKLLEINKDNERLFQLANFYNACGLFGSELVLGQCYEKGKGVEKNLKTAIGFYKKGLKKHKEGCGFLYRLARVFEKEGINLFQDFYKICFVIYNKLFEEDKANINNMWILDAYRLASMFTQGRGVKKDLPRGLQLIDIILEAKITPETSSYICLYFYALAIKKKRLLTCENFSSILSLESQASNNGNEGIFLSNSGSQNKNYSILSDIHLQGLENFSHMVAKQITNIQQIQQKDRKVIFTMPETYSMSKKLSTRTQERGLNVSIVNNSKISSGSDMMKVDKPHEYSSVRNTSKENICISINNESFNSSAELEEAVINQIKKLFIDTKKAKKSESETKKQDVDLVLIQGYIENIKKSGVKMIDINNLVYDEVIGNGGYSKVYAGWYNNSKVAIKEFKNINEKTIKKIFEEINVQTSLKDERINRVLYLGVDISPLKICCINKYMAYNLRFVINNIKLELIQKLVISKQIIEAINYLHSQSPPIVHRDLKPENILMNDEFNIELCDFGVYKTLYIDKTIAETLNQFYTVRYAPPEVIKNCQFICKASDIWSLGLVLYDIFYDSQAWIGLSSEEVFDAIKKEKPFPAKKCEQVPTGITTMIRNCTNYEHSKRPKIADILKDLIDIIYELNLV
jgi:TPR repeat protein